MANRKNKATSNHQLTRHILNFSKRNHLLVLYLQYIFGNARSIYSLFFSIKAENGESANRFIRDFCLKMCESVPTTVQNRQTKLCQRNVLLFSPDILSACIDQNLENRKIVCAGYQTSNVANVFLDGVIAATVWFTTIMGFYFIRLSLRARQ